MRVTIDVMGAPAGSGGMNLYAKELVLAWAEEFPADELTLVGGDWIRPTFGMLPGIRLCPVQGTSVFCRIWTQLVGSALIARRYKSDWLLSLSPVVSPLFPDDRRAVVVHDWRHKRRPSEFSLAQRLYRRIWEKSVASAGIVFSISEKTAAETIAIAHPRELVTVRNGGDHPRRWRRVKRDSADSTPLIVTFGHLKNKRPEAVISAVSHLAELKTPVNLVVLGASGEYRDRLQSMAHDLGLSDSIEFPGFVSETRYESIIQRCSLLVMNSSDEGFGLPVSEALYLGIPVVVASDSGLGEIHSGSVIVSSPEGNDLALAIAKGLQNGLTGRGRVSTWGGCAATIRSAIQAQLGKTSSKIG